jgi:hypothetical protein
MKGESKAAIGNLELNRETLTDLADEQAEEANGGKCPPTFCPSVSCEEIPQ